MRTDGQTETQTDGYDEANSRLKHFIIQQMHKYIIRRHNYNYYKIFKNI